MLVELGTLHPLVAARILQMIGESVPQLQDAPTDKHREIIISSLLVSARQLPSFEQKPEDSSD